MFINLHRYNWIII